MKNFLLYVTVVVLSPHHPRNTSLPFASEWAQELEKKGTGDDLKEDHVNVNG